MKTLVAYYSRAGENYFGGKIISVDIGNTEKVADLIVQQRHADRFKIEQEEPYAYDYQTCIAQAKADLKKQARPKLKRMLDSVEEYDVIYLGYPNYWGDLPMAVYTFLESIKDYQKIIYPFCTHEGSGLGKTCTSIQRICPKAIVKKGLSIQGSQVDQKKDEILGWLSR